MLKMAQYQLVKGNVSTLTWTHNGVFRRGTTLKWRSFTFDPGIGTPYVWMVATCSSSNRLFIQPPRFPQPEVRETLREALIKSTGREFLIFRWPEEEEA